MMPLYGNPGDYAWGRGGFDAIVTQLLNQMDGTGPPPMSTDDIKLIPTIKVNQTQVGEFQRRHKYTVASLAKRDLWGLGPETWFVVVSYAFAKMISPLHRDMFCQFLCDRFITAIVVNSPEMKLAKRTSVHWRIILAKA